MNGFDPLGCNTATKDPHVFRHRNSAPTAHLVENPRIPEVASRMLYVKPHILLQVPTSPDQDVPVRL